MFKEIFFDLGNVIINFCYENMCTQLANLFDVETRVIEAFLFKKNTLNDYESGAIDTEKFLNLFCKKMEKQVKQEPFVEALSNIFSPNQDSISLVKQLKSS